MKNQTCLLIALALAICGLALLKGMLMRRPLAATSVHAGELQQHCVFESVTVTADLGVTPGISDTLPGTAEDRPVYFTNVAPGIITLTVTITNIDSDGTCHFAGAAAFGQETYQYHAIGEVNRTVELTYPVSVTHASQTIAMTASENITGTIGVQPYERRELTFTQDITPPLILSPVITVTGPVNYLYAVGTYLFYTNTHAQPEPFKVGGRSADTGSGTRRTTFSSADLDSEGSLCGSPAPAASASIIWSAEYCLRGLPDAGVLTATSYDYVGNTAPITFTYKPDGAPPKSEVTATVSESFGKTPIKIEWATDDGDGCGVDTMDHYCSIDGGDWTYCTTTTGVAGTFDFVPPTVTLAGPITYGLASAATDHLGNAEPLPGEADTIVVVRPARLYLPLVVREFPPAWKRGSNTAGIRFYTPSGCGGNTWYAGTPDGGVVGVWKSTDNVKSWARIVTLSPYPFPVVANPNDCNQAFVSVWGSGVYHITDSSARPINHGLDEKYVYGLAIVGQTLYAGTSNQGVYKTDINNIAWDDKNNGIVNRRIRSLTVVGNRVYAGARACTFYFSDDNGNSWSERVVLSSASGCGDAQVWSVAEVKGVTYAGLGLGKGLYYDTGSGWEKVDAIPDNIIYGLAYDNENNYLYVSTYDSGIYRCKKIDGTDEVQGCRQYNQGLTTLNMREIKIHDELLVVGSDDGVWYLPLVR